MRSTNITKMFLLCKTSGNQSGMFGIGFNEKVNMPSNRAQFMVLSSMTWQGHGTGLGLKICFCCWRISFPKQASTKCFSFELKLRLSVAELSQTLNNMLELLSIIPQTSPSSSHVFLLSESCSQIYLLLMVPQIKIGVE